MVPQPPAKLSLANLPTELRLLSKVSASLGGGRRIWLKSDDLTGSVLSGNKVRKLEFLLAEAIAQGCDTVLTCGGLQSNHCRATAAAAARVGLHCHLLLRGTQPGKSTQLRQIMAEQFPSGLEGNLFLDTLCGAEVSVFSPSYYNANLAKEFQRIASEYEAQGRKCYSIPTGGSNAMGLWGYIEAVKELLTDFDTHGFHPDAIVCASGSGGTQGGLTLGAALEGLAAPVYGVAVCDSAAFFDAKIRDDVAAWQRLFCAADTSLSLDLAVHTIDDYIGPGYAKTYPELLKCIQWVARSEGVVLDPVYTGKAFYGMLQEIHAGKLSSCTDIVFVHTGGIYGLFPFKGEFD